MVRFVSELMYLEVKQSRFEFHESLQIRRAFIYTQPMRLDLQIVFAVAGIALTVFFGIWSIVGGKIKTGSRFVKLFLVLVILYSGQIVGAKLMGKPPLSEVAFGSAVSVMLVWIMIATMHDAE